MVAHKSFGEATVLRNTVFALGIAAAAVLFVPGAANAATDSYTPTPPNTPTLAGSTAIAECAGDVPWIHFNVTLVDPDGQVSDQSATLFMTDGANSHTVALGNLSGNHLEGRVLWPGASEGGGWPGWEQVNGTWTQTSGNFAWTKGNITAEIRMNPSLTVPLSYPPASAQCAQPASMALPLTDEGGLAATGGAVPMLAIGVGGAAVLLGGGLLFKRRQQKH